MGPGVNCLHIPACRLIVDWQTGPVLPAVPGQVQGGEGWPCHTCAGFAVEVSGSGMYFVPILSPRI